MPAWLSLKLGLRLLALVAALAFAWWLYSFVTASPKAEARLGKNTTEAAVQSGRDVVETVSGVADRERNLDKGTEDAARKIDEAPDAAGADAAGRERLCQISPDLCRQ
jgi:hypothetical protein